MDEIEKEFKGWIKRITPRAAVVAIMDEGVSFTTADRIVRGVYASDPKPLVVAAIRRAMAK